MPGLQRILVIRTTADQAEVARIRDGLARDRVVITAPTPEAARVVRTLAAEPRVEMLLGPESLPRADRGHRLDALVRRYAVDDRFREVVVVTDAATSTLLLEVLAPHQPVTGGAVTVVGLPRGDRPVQVKRAIISGVVLGVAAGVTGPIAPLPTLPVVAALVGLALLLVGSTRHLGRELLLAAAVSLAVVLFSIAGSARFPGAW